MLEQAIENLWKSLQMNSKFDTALEFLEPMIRDGVLSPSKSQMCIEFIRDNPWVVKEVDEFGETLLMLASDACNVAVVSELCRLGANVNAVAETGAVSLVCAVRSDLSELDILKTAAVILSHGGSPDIFGFMGCNSLHWAVVKGCVPLVDLLLQNGADVNLRSSDRDMSTAMDMLQSSRFNGSETERNQILDLLTRKSDT